MSVSRVNIKFNSVTEQDLIREFFEDGDNPYEKAIEQVYVSKTSYATSDYVTIRASGHDDGTLSFRRGANREVAFRGRQEVLRNVNPTPCAILKKVLQDMHYHWQDCIKPISPPNYNHKVFIVSGSKFYSYLYIDEVLPVIYELVPLFETIKCSACNTWKHIEMKQVVLNAFNAGKLKYTLHKYNCNENFSLDEIYKQFYLKFLE